MHSIISTLLAVAGLAVIAAAAPTANGNSFERRTTPTPDGGWDHARGDDYHQGACSAPNSYMIPYDQFQKYDETYPLNTWWSFESEAGLDSSLEQMGSLPWQPEGSLYAWHVKPNFTALPAGKTDGVVSAKASVWACVTPGHQYNMQIAIGGVEGQYPKAPMFNASVDGNFAIENWHVCDYPWLCPGDYTSDEIKLRTTVNGQQVRILPSMTDSLIGIPGPRPDSMSEGQWMKAEFKFDWPVSDITADNTNPGVWLTRTWMKTWS